MILGGFLTYRSVSLAIPHLFIPGFLALLGWEKIWGISSHSGRMRKGAGKLITPYICDYEFIVWGGRISIMPKHILFLSVGPVHLYRRETISRLHTERLSCNRPLQENMELRQIFLVRTQYCPPLLFPQSSVIQPTHSKCCVLAFRGMAKY